jgi:hypothetical protein
MKRTWILGLAAIVVFAAVPASAQTPSATPQAGSAWAAAGPSFVDNDGDGICDTYQTGARPANGQGAGYGRGRGNGTRVGPQDGTGYGPGAAAGTGACEGTGPKGNGGRGPRR